jgi:hypothetical protein
MDYNNIIIFLIFCLTLSLIYTSYIKFEKKYSVQDKTKKTQIDNFFIDDLNIKSFDKNNESFNNKEGFINELIIPKKKINDKVKYLDVSIETEDNITKPGEELIKKQDSPDLNKLNNIYNNYNENKSKHIYEKMKKISTDLPIANLHINLLLNNENNNNIKLSTLLTD